MRAIRVALVMALMAVSGVAVGAPPAVGGRGGSGGAAPAAPANLGAAMRDMGSALRSLKAEVADPAKTELALKDLATMQRDAAISKLQVPPIVAKMTGEQKAKSLEEYRIMMVGLMRNLLDLEQAVTDKKADDVKKLMTGLEDIMNKGHAEFAPGE